jgi:hypothetical protein
MKQWSTDYFRFETRPVEFRLWRTPCGGFHRVKLRIGDLIV